VKGKNDSLKEKRFLKAKAFLYDLIAAELQMEVKR
jgi:hypothetical protein